MALRVEWDFDKVHRNLEREREVAARRLTSNQRSEDPAVLDIAARNPFRTRINW